VVRAAAAFFVSVVGWIGRWSVFGAARIVASLALTLLAARDAAAWGGHVHVLVNGAATQHLPPEFAGFAQWKSTLESLASEADARRCCDPNEDARHYIDIDAYAEFFSRTLPRTYPEMVARFGRERVDGNGIVPWAIETALTTLTQHFRDGDWTRAVAVAADIGHYVADAHQPLHLTVNYDGQMSGQRGVHSRYESVLTEIYFNEIDIPPAHAAAFVRPLDAVFAWIEDVYPGASAVMIADSRAAWAAGGDTGSLTYYEVLWRETGADTRRWIRRASLAVAAMWLTAWYDAGAPTLPGGEPGVVPMPALRLLPNEPNPFNPRTKLRFEVPERGPARLRVYDVRGRLVRTLLDADPGPGERSLSWDGRDDNGRLLASGSYRIQLEQHGRKAVRSAVLVR
jgi:hypothetical protein